MGVEMSEEEWDSVAANLRIMRSALQEIYDLCDWIIKDKPLDFQEGWPLIRRKAGQALGKAEEGS
jgi:hypothetical protein